MNSIFKKWIYFIRRSPFLNLGLMALTALVILFYLFFWDRLSGGRVISEIEDPKHGIFNTILSWPLAVAGSALAIGFITMSLVDGVKPRLRQDFHRARLQEWLKFDESRWGQWNEQLYEKRGPYADRVDQLLDTPNQRSVPRLDQAIVMRALLLQTTAGDANALLSLPTANLCGQLVVALQAAMDAADRNHELLYVVVCGFAPEKELGKDLIEFVAGAKQLNEDDIAYFDAKNRVAHHIQRRIDAFQINTQLLWRSRLGITALITSFLVSLFGWWLSAPAIKLNTAGAIILTGLLSYEGAYIARLLNDALSAIKLKK